MKGIGRREMKEQGRAKGRGGKNWVGDVMMGEGREKEGRGKGRSLLLWRRREGNGRNEGTRVREIGFWDLTGEKEKEKEEKRKRKEGGGGGP